MRVKCLAQEHNTMTWPGLKHGPLYPESSMLTIKPPFSNIKTDGTEKQIWLNALLGVKRISECKGQQAHLQQNEEKQISLTANFTEEICKSKDLKSQNETTTAVVLMLLYNLKQQTDKNII